MPRLVAWQILRSGSPLPLREVDAACEAADLDARDRGFVRRLVGTEVRRRGTLRALVRHFARGKPGPDLAAHLHVGLVQLFFLDRVPDHAAVDEASRAVHQTLGGAKVRYVNAVLRNALRARREGHSGDPRQDLVGRDVHLAEPVFADPTTHPFLWAEDALSMPAQLMKRWSKRFGPERADLLARAALVEPPLSVRATGGADSRGALGEELAALGFDPLPATHPQILLLSSEDAEGIGGTQAFREGRATVQGETALRAAELVGAQQGERILDLCAAPGGKTAVLAEAGAQVLATDQNARRLVRLVETVTRLGVSDRVRVVALDGARGLQAEAFDAVLVDAPCSNTGVLAQRPGARWRWGPATRASLTELQGRLLEEAAPCVRPGGRLVWSTCALEPEENGQRVRAFLDAHPDWQLEEEHELLPDPFGASADASPTGAGRVDGGYAARLRLETRSLIQRP